jgi:Arc/MetJ family transcription regulator
MNTTFEIDDELLERAARLTGPMAPSMLVHEALRALIERESARRLACAGGSMPDLQLVPRRRPADPAT